MSGLHYLFSAGSCSSSVSFTDRAFGRKMPMMKGATTAAATITHSTTAVGVDKK